MTCGQLRCMNQSNIGIFRTGRQIHYITLNYPISETLKQRGIHYINMHNDAYGRSLDSMTLNVPALNVPLSPNLTHNLQ